MISASNQRPAALFTVALAALISLSPALAGAQPSPAQKETARALVEAGRTKRTSGDLRGALADFKAAHAIMSVPTTGLEVGRAEEQLGMLVEARDTLLEVARLPADRRDPAAFERAREQAKSMAEAIAKRIPSVRLVITGVPPGATPEVALDGVDLKTETLGAPLKMNPGKHRIIGSVGGSARVIDVELDEGADREIQLDLGAATPVGPRPRTNPMVFIGFSLAGAGLIAGGVTGALAMRSYASVSVRCPNGVCPPDTHEDLRSGKALGTASTISFIVAGVGAAAGVVGLFLPLKGSPAPASGGSDNVSIWVGAGSAGVRGAF
jgi:hypothetical protein